MNKDFSKNGWMTMKPLSDKEIETFINSFKDFIQRAEVAEDFELELEGIE